MASVSWYAGRRAGCCAEPGVFHLGNVHGEWSVGLSQATCM